MSNELLNQLLTAVAQVALDNGLVSTSRKRDGGMPTGFHDRSEMGSGGPTTYVYIKHPDSDPTACWHTLEEQNGRRVDVPIHFDCCTGTLRDVQLVQVERRGQLVAKVRFTLETVSGNVSFEAGADAYSGKGVIAGLHAHAIAEGQKVQGKPVTIQVKSGDDNKIVFVNVLLDGEWRRGSDLSDYESAIEQIRYAWNLPTPAAPAAPAAAAPATATRSSRPPSAGSAPATRSRAAASDVVEEELLPF